MSEVFTLTGDGATGLLTSQAHQKCVANLPVEVKLGRLAPPFRPKALSLASFVHDLKGAPIPASIDWHTKAAEGLARMYLNNQYGDCVIAGKGHALAVWSANDNDSGPQVLATDQEIYQQYQAVCGPGDHGCYIHRVLDYMQTQGFLAGGKRYFIDGYVSCDWRSKELTQIGIALFGAGTIGFNLPGNWINANVWDVSNANGFIGGHDVTPCGYGSRVLGTNSDGVVISSWGRLYLMTWAAWTSTRFIDEMYFMVPSFVWTGTDGMAPSHVNLVGLKAALAQIGSGQLPPLPDPNPVPPVPPVPPSPPSPPVPVPPPPVVMDVVGQTDPTNVSFSGPLGRTFAITIPSLAVSGLATPRKQSGDADGFGELIVFLGKHGFHPFQFFRAHRIAIRMAVAAGLECYGTERLGGEIRRGKLLTPEQWSKLFDFIIKILPIILALLSAAGPASEFAPDNELSAMLALHGCTAESMGMSYQDWAALIAAIAEIIAKFKK